MHDSTGCDVVVGVKDWYGCGSFRQWVQAAIEAEIDVVIAKCYLDMCLDGSKSSIVLSLIGDQVIQRSKTFRSMDRNGMC